jgi:type I restriction enzyme S subunit
MSQFFKEKLGDLYKINTGKANTVDQVEDGQYSFFGRGKKIMKSNSYLYDCDAIIIAGEGTSFFPKQFSGKFNLHQRAYAIHSSNGKVDIQYLNYFLFFNEKYFQNVAVGATAKSLRLRHFIDLEIPFPSINEQKHIVKKLDTCMEQIDKAIKNVEQNIQNAEDLFQSQLNEVLSSNKDGWIEKKLGEVCKLITKGTTPTSVGYKFIDEGINFVKVESIALDGSFIKTKFAHISIDCHNKLKRSQLKEGDIIFSIAGALGRTAIVTDEILPANTNQALSILRLKNDVDIDVKYLLYTLSNKDALEQVKNYGGGTAQQNLSLTQMKSFKLTFPSLHIQNQIVLKLDKIKIITQLLKSNYQNELKALNELKQSILEKAFNGEL